MNNTPLYCIHHNGYRQWLLLHVLQSADDKVCGVNEPLHAVGETGLRAGVHSCPNLVHALVPAEVCEGVHVGLKPEEVREERRNEVTGGQSTQLQCETLWV